MSTGHSLTAIATVHEATGGHAIQTDPTATSEQKQYTKEQMVRVIVAEEMRVSLGTVEQNQEKHRKTTIVPEEYDNSLGTIII